MSLLRRWICGSPSSPICPHTDDAGLALALARPLLKQHEAAEKEAAARHSQVCLRLTQLEGRVAALTDQLRMHDDRTVVLPPKPKAKGKRKR